MVATETLNGLRLGELYGLRWADIGLDARRLSVMRSYGNATTKGKDQRHLGLHSELEPILRAWKVLCPPTEEGLVFPVKGHKGYRMGYAGRLRVATRALHRAADTREPAKSDHILRHSFASHAVMSGVPLDTVQALLGHTTPAMTQRYAHLAPGYLREAVDAVTFHVSTTPAPVAPPNGTATAPTVPRRYSRSRGMATRRLTPSNHE
jgi:integrase